MKPALTILLPIGSRRRNIVKKLLQKLHLRNYALVAYYNTWVQQKNEHPALAFLDSEQEEGPLISIVVPAFNTPSKQLEELIYSITSQAYSNWELILINASTEPTAKKHINSCGDFDNRIRVIEAQNEGISGNTNRGIKAAQGEFIAFVDHDDTLDPFALREVAQAIKREEADIVYSDEDKISENGELYFDPHFKPDWSPDLLTHVNYVNHLTVVRKSLLNKVGLLDPAKDGAQDYDLLLRLFDTKPTVSHIPKVLYHWRAARNSTAQNFASKTNITNAGKRALEEHFVRGGVKVEVKPKADRPGFYELKPLPYTTASLIITPFASDALLRLYIDLLLRSTKLKNYKLELIVPEGAAPPGSEEYCKVISLAATADFLTKAIERVSNEELVIINTIALPLTKDWLKTLSAILRFDHVGGVAPLLVHHNSLVEDCGLVYVSDKELAPLFKNEPYENNQTFFGNTDWVRNVDALSGNFVVTRTSALKSYLQNVKQSHDPKALLSRYSLEISQNSHGTLFNTIFSDVVFDNHSIRLQPNLRHSSYFNPNLVTTGKGFEIYTPESAALNILIRLKEDIVYGEVGESVVKF